MSHQAGSQHHGYRTAIPPINQQISQGRDNVGHTRSLPTNKAFPLTVIGVVIAADASVEKATAAAVTALKPRITKVRRWSR